MKNKNKGKMYININKYIYYFYNFLNYFFTILKDLIYLNTW